MEKHLPETGNFEAAVEIFETAASQLEALAQELLADDRAWLKNLVACMHGLPEAEPEAMFSTSLFEVDAKNPSVENFVMQRVLPIIKHLADGESSGDLLKALNIDPLAFHHNLPVNLFYPLFMGVRQNIESDEIEHEMFSWNILFLPEVIQQSAQHLRSVIRRKDILDGQLTVKAQGFNAGKLTETIVASRAMFQPVCSQDMKAHSLGRLIEAGKLETNDLIPTNIQILGGTKAYEKSTLDADLVAAIVYYLVSNASKKLAKEVEIFDENGGLEDIAIKPIEHAQLDIKWSPVNFEGQDYLALQVFDTGEYIDTHKLYETLVEAAQQRPEQIAEIVGEAVTQKIANAPQQHGLKLEKLVSSDKLPFFRGFSATGSSGIGTAEARILATGGGGEIMMDNVVSPNSQESGVAVTVLIPQNLDPENLDKIRQVTEALKDAIQLGDFTLEPRQEEEAA